MRVYLHEQLMNKSLKILFIPSFNREANSEIRNSKALTHHEISFAKFNNIIIKIDISGVHISYNNIDLNTYDFVWVSSSWATQEVASAIVLYLDYHKVKHTKVDNSSSKLTDLVKLSLSNIPVPRSWYQRKILEINDIEKIQQFLSSPIISKSTTGLKGNNVKLITSDTNFKKMLNRKNYYFFQSYIPNEFEWSIICAHGKVKSIAKKIRQKNEYRNNVHLGATEIFLDLKDVPNQVCKLATSASDILNLDWCRVDILEDSDTKIASVLEVNRFPGLTKQSPEIVAAVNCINNYISGLD